MNMVKTAAHPGSMTILHTTSSLSACIHQRHSPHIDKTIGGSRYVYEAHRFPERDGNPNTGDRPFARTKNAFRIGGIFAICRDSNPSQGYGKQATPADIRHGIDKPAHTIGLNLT
jgi:hypothetical protein